MVRRHPSRNGKPKAAQSITRTQPFRTRYQLVVSGKNFKSGSQPNWEKKKIPIIPKVISLPRSILIIYQVRVMHAACILRMRHAIATMRSQQGERSSVSYMS
jgi:hypothetical protein